MDITTGQAIFLLASFLILGSLIMACLDCAADQRKKEKEREVARKWQLKHLEAADTEK